MGCVLDLCLGEFAHVGSSVGLNVGVTMCQLYPGSVRSEFGSDSLVFSLVSVESRGETKSTVRVLSR